MCRIGENGLCDWFLLFGNYLSPGRSETDTLVYTDFTYSQIILRARKFPFFISNLFQADN